MSSPHAIHKSRGLHFRAHSRHLGMTLIEILISTAVTLIMIFAIVQIFESVGSAVAQGRAAIEMSGQIRGAAHRLREDIRAVTVPMRPWPRSSAAEGYFEIYEDPDRDSTYLATDSRIGDRRDVIAFTARSVDEPFVGRFNGNAIESQVAEIIWWAIPDSNGNFSLHRRVLLVRPDLTINLGNGTNPLTLNDMQNFYNDNDVSVRFVPNNAGVAIALVTNTLADLTKRENRFAHTTSVNFPFGTFPFPIDVSSGNPTCLVNLGQFGLHQGDDIVVSHLQAFDIRVFDPQAQIRADDNNHALLPSDPGWGSYGGNIIGYGAFVDLNYFGGPGSVFSGPAHPLSQFQFAGLPAGASVYDTWSFHYEHDGINQDWSTTAALRPYPLETWRQAVDQGTNGIDDNYVPPPPNPPPSSNGPDDVYERETSPPYPVPLRGIQIKIRLDDPDSRQVREATVVSEFIPE